MIRRLAFFGIVLLATASCDDDVVGTDISAPTNLAYRLDPSGDPDAPLGILLEWDPVVDAGLEVYNVYSSLDGGQFDLRGSTTSLTFHDAGVPDLEYYVTALSTEGVESVPSNTITVDERLRLDDPAFLTSTSLDGAVLLAWDDDPFQNTPEGFSNYRIYSTGFDLDDTTCDAVWTLEGTSVSPEFIVSALSNGVPLCFAVSAESIEGFESLWSPIRSDTPRPEARNVVVFRDGANANESGFSFFLDGNGDDFPDPNELGIVTAGSRGDIDFMVRDAGGILVLDPVRDGVGVALYSNDPIDDLTAIDIAPETGFDPTPIEATPGFGYVFEMPGTGFPQYGAVRITHVGQDFVIFDWAYQTDPGNPELLRHGGLPVAKDGGGIVIPR